MTIRHSSNLALQMTEFDILAQTLGEVETMALMKRIWTALIFATLLAFNAAHAHATSSIFCEGMGNDADISILFGAGPMLSALEVDASFKDSELSTRDREGVQKALILQFSADENALSLELMDDQADQHLASLRLLRQMDVDAEPIQVGILSFTDGASAGVVCTGP